MNLNATILGQIISFILFVWFCMKYIWYPLISIIEKRQKKISDSFDEIKKSTIESTAAHNEALNCLKQARIQAQEIIQHAYECKIKILNDAENEANQERNKILSNVKTQINQEKQKVYDELRKKISQLVITSTEKIIEQSINEIIDYNLIDNIINTLPIED